MLGSGAFGSVYKGTMRSKAPILSIYKNVSIDLSDDRVAIKMLPPNTDDRNRAHFMDEMNLMKRLGYHAHIVSLLGCVSDPNRPMIVVEYCANGDMLRFLQRNKKIRADTV